MRTIIVLTLAAVSLVACDQGTDDTDIDAVTPAEAEGPSGEPVAEETPAIDTTGAASLAPRIPVFNAICGPGIEVHANEGGPVFIDGEKTTLEKFNDNYFEASLDGTTISISFNPDESLSLTYTGPDRANGICTLQ
ncbi:hypothetical protein [Alteriqipengyuania sp. 357]